MNVLLLFLYIFFFALSSFPVRMTPEEVRTIQIIKEIFGAKNVIKFGVLLFTNGESFKHNPRETFTEYLQREVNDYKMGYQDHSEEPLGKLIKDVNTRCVVFDNSDDHDRSDVEDLVETVDVLMRRNNYDRYKKPIVTHRQIVLIALSLAGIGIGLAIILSVLTS